MKTAARISEILRRFGRDDHGGLPMQMALGFGAVAIAAAVLLSPMLEDAGDQYARHDGYGIDRTVTGSIGSSSRYRIRNSVLSKKPEIICGRPPAPVCPTIGR